MRKETAFLLRMWNDGASDAGWRASLQEVHSKEVMGFASLEKLFNYLAEHELIIYQDLSVVKDLNKVSLD